MYLNNSVLYHAASYRKHREHSMCIKQWSKSKNDPNHSSTISTDSFTAKQSVYLEFFKEIIKVFISCFCVSVEI